MYKSFSKSDWLNILKFPKYYTVDAVIMVGTPSKENHLKIVAKALTELNLNALITDFIDKDFVRCTEIKINGKTIWFDTSYGSAYLSEIVHVGSVLGSKYNILLGSCGGLQKSTKAMDIIIPTYSYGDESTTRLYQRDNIDNVHFANVPLLDEFKNIFSKNYTVHCGPTITCQAHLAETSEDIISWEKDGYLGVEMEASSVFAVSNNFNVPSVALLHVNDNLIEKEFVGSELNISKKEIKLKLILDKYKVVLEYLLNNL